jgi:hypothetical protein
LRRNSLTRSEIGLMCLFVTFAGAETFFTRTEFITIVRNDPTGR